MASKAPSFRSVANPRGRSRKSELLELVETVPLAALILDRELRVQALNHRYCELFRADEESTLGCSVYALGEGQWGTPEIRRLLEDALLDRGPASVGVARELPALGARALKVHARSLPQPAGAGALVIAFDDVTDAAPPAAQPLDEAADGRQTEFLASLSHKLRGQLGSMANWLHVLTTGRPDAALQRQGLEAIEQALREQTRTVDALDARIAAAKKQP